MDIRSKSRDARINDVLYTIHKDIAAELTASALATQAAWTESHFHRMFRRVTGETVHGYVRRTRLEHAANLLTFDPGTPVREVMTRCGFSSLSSFSHAFRSQFGSPPASWRRGENKTVLTQWTSDPETSAAHQRIALLELPPVSLVERQPTRVAYLRHKGYGRHINVSWQRLRAWCLDNRRPMSTQIGLHHSNPALVPLDDCRYVACVAIDTPLLKRGTVHSLTIPGGLHARFSLSGTYSDLLPWIDKVQRDWLPESGYHLRTTPSFVVYHDNPFLSDSEQFELDFYLPLTLY